MIDWWFVGVNALWIVGASVVLSAASYHHYLAPTIGLTFMQVVRDPTRGLVYDVGTVMFCIGWMLSGVEPHWLRWLWMLLTLWVIWLGYDREKRARMQCAEEAAATEAPDNP
jgi:hypothetical protein